MIPVPVPQFHLNRENIILKLKPNSTSIDKHLAYIKFRLSCKSTCHNKQWLINTFCGLPRGVDLKKLRPRWSIKLVKYFLQKIDCKAHFSPNIVLSRLTSHDSQHVMVCYRAEKTEVLNEEELILERKVEQMKNICLNVSKKVQGCLHIQPQGGDVEKRLVSVRNMVN